MLAELPMNDMAPSQLAARKGGDGGRSGRNQGRAWRADVGTRLVSDTSSRRRRGSRYREKLRRKRQVNRRRRRRG